MGAFIDLTGQRFGRLVVLHLGSRARRGGDPYWLCECTCKTQKEILSKSLLRGLTRSCGCLQKEAVTTHGMKKTPEWQAWQRMKLRCYNQNFPSYEYYGGAGILVCDAWLNSFEQFYKSVGPRPSSGHSLDRWPNPFGNYEPGNVRWATAKEQIRNRRNTKRYIYQGRNLTLGEIADLTAKPYNLLYGRVRCGWSIDQAVSA